MAPSELKFYKAPQDEAGNPLWVPIVIKNRDQLIGFIDGVNMTASIYNIDRESMFYTLSSERFNDIIQNGTRLRNMSNTEFFNHAKDVIENGYVRLSAKESRDNSGTSLNDFCLTLECSCGNFIGFKDCDKIPNEDMHCDICGRIVIQYTNDEDDFYVYDGIPGRNNEALLGLINDIQSDEEEDEEDEEGPDKEGPDKDGW